MYKNQISLKTRVYYQKIFKILLIHVEETKKVYNYIDVGITCNILEQTQLVKKDVYL